MLFRSHFLSHKKVAVPSAHFHSVFEIPHQVKRFDWRVAAIMIIGLGIISYFLYDFVNLGAIVKTIAEIEHGGPLPTPIPPTATPLTPIPTEIPTTPTPLPIKTPFTERDRSKQNERVQRIYGKETWYQPLKKVLTQEMGHTPDPMDILFNMYRVQELREKGKIP